MEQGTNVADLYQSSDRSRDHYATWSNFGWSCTCGAGREWALAPVVRARVAAQAHQRAEIARNNRRAR